MAVSRKFIKRASTATLLMWMTVNLISPLAYAQEATPTETPTENTPEPTSPPAEPTQAPAEPTPVPEVVNTAGTGDAQAVTVSDTTTNTNINVLPGDITQPATECVPQGETICPTDITINNDNTATVSADLSAAATTGDNSSTAASGSAEITTGDAAAIVQSDTTVNTNAVILSDTETPTPTETPTITPTPTPGESFAACVECSVTPTPEQTPETETQALTVNDTNAANVAENTNVTSITGNNTATTGSGTVTVSTGNADSLASVLNVINTNIVGSDVQVLTLDLTCTENEDVDLNSIWKELLVLDENGNVTVNSNYPQSSNLKISITNDNQAALTNTVNVTADTGNNTASGSASTVNTGDAAALANVTNFVNTNILGSKFLLANINILTAQKMNLILPRPEYFDAGSSTMIFKIPVTYANQNQAEINNTIAVTANTGNVTTTGSGDNSAETGNAASIVNSTTIANTNIYGNTWFYLILNNAGGWTGNILNWSTPGSVEKPSIGANILETGINPLSGTEASESGHENLPAITFDNNNQAEVTNNIQVTANTGNISATGGNGGTFVKTGNALAVANLFNLINTNILGSRWFLNSVNIMGDWSGDAIFAYPDVGVEMTADRFDVQPGDVVNLNLHYENSGYDTARGVKVYLDLPSGMNFVADTGKLTGGCQQTFCSWEIGNINPKQGGDFGVSVRINDNFSFDNKTAFWEKLVPSVMAESGRKSVEIPVKATIQMANPDPNTSDNSYSLQTVVYEKLSGSAASDQRQPNISLSASHNVSNFVYPGDTVTFEMKVDNNSDVPLYKAQLIQKLYGANGEYLGSMLFELGTAEAGKNGRLNFGLTIPESAAAGVYTTSAYVTGEAPNGSQITSGSTDTNFKVKLKPQLITIPATVEPPISGEVLGAADIFRGPWCTDRKQDIWIFVMLLMTSGVLFANRIEEKMDKSYVKKT